MIEELLGREWHLSIGGEPTPHSGHRYDIDDPSTGEVVAQAPDGGEKVAQAAVAAADDAVHYWRETTLDQRAKYLNRLAAALEERSEEFALLDSICGGGSIRDMRRDTDTAVKTLRYFAGVAPQLVGETIPATRNLHFTERIPFGVVVRIVAFNHPFLFTVARTAAPLMAGNCVVMKPPESAPLSALLFAEIAADILPRGVLSVVVGQGPTLPRALVHHPKVRRIGFIGSAATGRLIQQEAAATNVKSVTLELGGKNALIAFPDANVDIVAEAAVRGMNFGWSGQSCGSTSRLLLHDDIADAVLERVVARVRAFVLGPAVDETTDQGPLISHHQMQSVLDDIATGRADGAHLLTGGGRPPGLGGYFVEPTVFDHVTPSMRIAQKEIFGPVLSAMRWRSVEEAVELANGVDYGLTASIYTPNIDSALTTARQMETGFVWINGVGPHFNGVPYGGVKDSGVGRDDAFEELASYTQTRATTIFLG